ncbi:DHA2 family multidrug resistance protein-like MFS transporter [Nocardia neocaledoniensis]|uniref:DHA2 family multidrug resistance protein-like MFS transporter n=1 Tax=Nocardia neocaledoniensis TaxID=236511 RepID=A0A317NQ33_9NOCA|nr:DHA2 family multidrug resistance protein-like MFS transporter [Nocardia neocaledoniensis]
MSRRKTHGDLSVPVGNVDEVTATQPEPTTAEPAGKAGVKEWIGLAVLALPTLLISMDMSVLYLAIPHLSEALHPSSSQLLWILDIYGFLVAGFLITMGTVGDRIGRRKLLMIGALAFGVASVVAAYSTSAATLIGTRALLGIAGATLMPSTLALIRNMFHDDRQRTTAISVWMTSFMVGMVIGPLVGGAMLENFWWGSVFLVAVPSMVLLLVAGPILLPEYKDPNPGKLDVLSAVLSLVSVMAVIYGIKELAKDGWALDAVAVLVGGLVLGAVFVLRQQRLTDPLIDLRLFGNVRFSGSLVALMVAMLAMGGLFLLLSQYLQLVLGLSAFEAGLWTVPQALAMVVAAGVVSALAPRIRPAYLMTGGLLIAMVGYAIFTQLSGADDLALIVTGMVVFSLGLSPMFVLGLDLIVGAVDPERAGAASAISETGQELSAALGVAVIGSIGTAVYRGRMADELPDGLPAELAHAAEDTLAGALQLAATLPEALGAELSTIARQAYTHALQVNSLVGIGLTAVAAGLVMVLLRHIPAPNVASTDTDEG